jgi:putative ABC transport system permease protein
MERLNKMDLGARFDKVLHDIWDNKTRSLLVIFTLAIGIGFVGMIFNTVRLLKRDLYGGYAQTNPASVNLQVSPFPKELATSVEALREVERAEAAREVTAALWDAAGVSHNLKIMSMPDFNNIQIHRLSLDKGKSEPGLREILIERDTARNLKVSVGDILTVEMDNGEKYNLLAAGIVHDMSTPHFSFSGTALGFINESTLEWLGEQPGYNLIRIIAAGPQDDRDRILRVANLARDRVIEPSGYKVLSIFIANNTGVPREYWAKGQVDGVLLILQIMSILAIFLCAGLVVNTTSAVIVQQSRQIGIMRAVGASRRQIILLYLGFIELLSLFGLIVAIPFGMIGSIALASLASEVINSQMGPVDWPHSIILFQVGLALIMPACAALSPILRGTSASVYETIYQYGLISGEAKHGWLEQQLLKIRNFHPPLMLSLRNTFRNKSRLAFTIITLTIAGGMFMAVASSYATLYRQIDELTRYISFDASIDIPGGSTRSTIEREALRVQNVNYAEGWQLAGGYIIHSDGRESDQVELVGLPQNSKTIDPLIISGRWLLSTDSDHVVINEDLLEKEPGLQVGDSIEVKVNDVNRLFEIVGIASNHMTGARIYMYDINLAKLTGRYNQVDTVRVRADEDRLSMPTMQEKIALDLEKRFDDAQLSSSSSKTRAEIFSALSDAFTILPLVLMLIAMILAVIGGMGLTGAMGLNVLERTREIGILRAVGASHFSVRQVIVSEGITVALISWAASALISYPIGRSLSEALISTTFGATSGFVYSYLGLFAWLGIVVLIGVIASLSPAQKAARLTVREVLSYE